MRQAYVFSYPESCVMFSVRCLRFPLLAILGLFVVTTAHAAGPSLGDAVQQADGKYLETPETGLVDSSPKIMVGGGEDGMAPLDEEISLGKLRVTLTYVAEAGAKSPAGKRALQDIPEEAMLPDELGLGQIVPHAPVVTVYLDEPAPVASPGDDETDMPADGVEASPAVEAAPAGPRIVATLKGDSNGSSDPPVSMQLAELDPNNPYPEIVVSFFSGGAHCCSVTHIITSNADGSEWKTIDVGEFDGGPMLAVDLDGNGVYEFETRDNAFLYAFGCYACSQAPLQVLALKDGELKDVSAEARFKPAHAAWLKSLIVGVPEDEANGFLAGYVAQKTRLGEGKQAWDLMLKHYDRKADWGLEICSKARNKAGKCPGKTTKVAFPQALKHMLKENGYRIEG